MKMRERNLQVGLKKITRILLLFPAPFLTCETVLQLRQGAVAAQSSPCSVTNSGCVFLNRSDH